MELLYNQKIFEFLQNESVPYLLAQTVPPDETDAETIFLEPVFEEPDLENLPHPYQIFYRLHEEPRQMASGIENCRLIIRLEGQLLESYVNFLLDRIKTKGAIQALSVSGKI